MSFLTSPHETEAPAVGNGAVHEPPASSPRVERRYAWVDLPPDAYPGFRARVWVNFPGKVQRDLDSGAEILRMKALGQMVVEHNGWLDFEGTPYPPASDLGERCEVKHPHPEGEECPGLIRPGFWDEIPTELAGALIGSVLVQVGKLTTSLQQPRRRR